MFINIQEVSHWYVPGVTCMLPVEAFATGVRIFKQQEVCLIVHSKGLERLILYRSKVELEPHDLDHLIFAVWGWPWFLDRLSKRALIAWFNFDPDHKCFYSGHISDYPLSFVTRIKMESMSILSKDQNNQQTTKKKLFDDTKNTWLPLWPLNYCKSSDQTAFHRPKSLISVPNASTGDIKVTRFCQVLSMF